jgi:superfamily II DNA or RNA helicase
MMQPWLALPAPWWPCPLARAKRSSSVTYWREGPALVLAHRDELIRLAVDKLLMVNADFEIGLVKVEENDVSTPIVVASVQTLSRPNRLAQLCQDFRTVIVDEAHHGVADTYNASWSMSVPWPQTAR